MIRNSANEIVSAIKQSQSNSLENSFEGSSALKHAEMREDTAIQRQVADLKAAGLNPILAAGGTGSSAEAAVKYTDSPATTSMANSAEKNATANLINSLANIFTSAGKLARK